MRNDSHKWDYPQDKSPDFTLNGVKVSMFHPHRQTLVSGPYGKAVKVSNVQKAYGWPDIVSGDHYALRLRRDRCLVVNGPELTNGWIKDSGLAISDMTGGYSVFQIEGSNAFDLIKRGTEISIGNNSDSVVRRFDGHPVLLYRWRTADCFRLHITRENSQALLLKLETIARKI